MVTTTAQAQPAQSNAAMIEAIRVYWNEHIHDLAIATQPIGSKGFFQELADYRFDKLRYLPEVVDFNGYRGKKLLEIGCGVGIDLLRFAQGGAQVTGIDLAEVSIDLARKNFEANDAAGEFMVMNGEAMDFPDNSFDVVYAHGVLQYTADVTRMISEMRRVLKPGGEIIIMVYNRISWLNALSKLMKVDLEHEDAPVLKKYSISEVRQMLKAFRDVRIVPERFPVKSKLHTGLKGQLYNTFFVGAYNTVPKALIRSTGWHIMAFGHK